MSLPEPVPSYTRTHPRHITSVISVLGYALVIGAFAGLVPAPETRAATVQLFSDLIAAINTMALLLLVAGWLFIKNGEIRKHRAAMLSSFALIVLFLVLYVWKVGGGLEKAFVGSTVVQYSYWTLLVIHIFLSVVSVPALIHAVVLGLTYSPAELRATAHPHVGRLAVATWTLSLFLVIITYVLLNHIYRREPIRRAAPLFLLSIRGITAIPSTDRQ